MEAVIAPLKELLLRPDQFRIIVQKQLPMVLRSPTSPGFCAASDHSLLVTFGNEISHETHKNVLRLTRLLLDQSHEGIINIHPAYSSVLLTVDPRVISISEAERHVRQLLKRIDSIELPPSRSVELPVCYGGDFGPDL